VGGAPARGIAISLDRRQRYPPICTLLPVVPLGWWLCAYPVIREQAFVVSRQVRPPALVSYAAFVLAGISTGALIGRAGARIALTAGGGAYVLAGLYLATRPPFAAFVPPPRWPGCRRPRLPAWRWGCSASSSARSSRPPWQSRRG
jgi:hypothetical protein